MDKQRRRLLHLGLLYGGVTLLGGRAFAQAGGFTEDADPESYRLVADIHVA